jgi:hypothetical protein
MIGCRVARLFTNIPKVKKYQKAMIYVCMLKGSILRPSKIHKNGDFWYGKIPSGNPVQASPFSRLIELSILFILCTKNMVQPQGIDRQCIDRDKG